MTTHWAGGGGGDASLTGLAHGGHPRVCALLPLSPCVSHQSHCSSRIRHDCLSIVFWTSVSIVVQLHLTVTTTPLRSLRTPPLPHYRRVDSVIGHTDLIHHRFTYRPLVPPRAWPHFPFNVFSVVVIAPWRRHTLASCSWPAVGESSASSPFRCRGTGTQAHEHKHTHTHSLREGSRRAATATQIAYHSNWASLRYRTYSIIVVIRRTPHSICFPLTHTYTHKRTNPRDGGDT